MAGSADNRTRIEPLDPSKASHKRMMDEAAFESNRKAAEDAGYAWTEDDERQAHEAAADELANDPTRQKAAPRPSRSRSTNPGGFATPVASGTKGVRGMLTGKNSGGTAAGFLFGFAAYCVGLNFLRYGEKGAVGWLTAKFVNEPYNPSTGKTSTTSAVTSLNGKAPATTTSTTSPATTAQTSTSAHATSAQAVLL